MKRKIEVLLISVGVVVILGIASYFPYGMVYEMTLDNMEYYANTPNFIAGYITLDQNTFRLRITIFTLILSALIILHMWPLKRACKSLGLYVFQKLLTVGMIYVGAMTVLMLGGLWLHFTDSGRIAFFFGAS